MKNNKSNIIPAGTMSIEDLENELNNPSGENIEILPNGDVKRKKSKKPLTFKKNLGCEYAA